MVFHLITDVIGAATNLGGTNDRANQLSCRYTILLLLFCCLLTSYHQYVGNPIICWPSEGSTFTDSMMAYMSNICWVKNTYPLDTPVIPTDQEEIRSRELLYYQWVPIIMCIQAFLFYVPHIIWLVLNVQTGCDISSIIHLYKNSDMLEEDSRKKSIGYVTAHMDKYLRANQNLSVTTGLMTIFTASTENHKPKHRLRRVPNVLGHLFGGSYITVIYGATKVLYLANACGQMFLLNAFLGRQYYAYGAELLRDAFAGVAPLQESSRFPHNTLCTFNIRVLGNELHSYHSNCLLTINYFNEKVYIFLWFWLIFVGVVTTVSLGMWMWKLTPFSRLGMCELWLKQAASHHKDAVIGDQYQVEWFATEYLQQDGALVVRLIEENVDEVVARETLLSMYECFRLQAPRGDVNGKHL